MPNIREMLKKVVLFKEPEKDEEFELKESEGEKAKIEEKPLQEDKEEFKHYKKKKNEELLLNKKSEEIEKDNGKQPDISSKLSESLEYMKQVFSIPICSDIILREFKIVVKDRIIDAFLIAIDGMVDRKVIDDDILQPLMILSNLDIKGDVSNLQKYIEDHLLPHNQLISVHEYEKVIGEVNFGGCGIFVDGMAGAFTADVKGFEHRGVEKPNTEIVLRGPQEGFNEIIRTNTALIRRRLKDEDLIVENVEIGKRSKTPCSLLYIRDIADNSLVDEARRRLKSIKVDYMFDTGELEQMIEDSTYFPGPQIIATERPDRVSSLLAEGRVAIIMNGTPFALVLPVTSSDLTHSPEDTYVRYPYANLLRGIRILAIFMSLLLPGLYVAVTNFHHEMIPTELLLAIEASREKVPFPSVVEILIMEVAFELIREAGIRIPGPIGPTLGIIGALILGQAAVAANIVSPILIIVVAVTGIGSFAVPNFSLAFAFRVLRFVFIFLGAMAGILGITTGMFILGLWFTNQKSFGVPYFSPYAPNAAKVGNEILRPPLWKLEMRPDYLNAKDVRRQPDISRKWASGKKGEKDSEK